MCLPNALEFSIFLSIDSISLFDSDIVTDILNRLWCWSLAEVNCIWCLTNLKLSFRSHVRHLHSFCKQLTTRIPLTQIIWIIYRKPSECFEHVKIKELLTFIWTEHFWESKVLTKCDAGIIRSWKILIRFIFTRNTGTVEFSHFFDFDRKWLRNTDYKTNNKIENNL